MDSGDTRLRRDVCSALLEGGRLLLTGAAGSGKTYFVRELVRELANSLATEGQRPDDRIVLTASTGIATTQLFGLAPKFVAGPFTVHRAGRIPWNSQPDPAPAITHGQACLACACVIIVDEISMLDSTTFERLMKRVPPNAGILAVGDFFQLPPVPCDEKGQPQYVFRSPDFGSPHFPFEMIELTGNHRQTDPEFDQHLHDVRRGGFDASYYDDVPNEFDMEHPVLFGVNRQVDAYNRLRLSQLRTPSVFVRPAVDVGERDRALKWLETNTRAMSQLELKEGMRVMCIQNHFADGRNVVNGDLGTVRSIGAVHSDGFPMVQVVFDSFSRLGEVTTIQSFRFEDRRLLPDGTEEVMLAVRQIPLRPAYGLTVHKAQGLTLNVVNIDGARIDFAPGQVYVAISRCRTKAGLRIANAGMLRAFAAGCVGQYYRTATRWIGWQAARGRVQGSQPGSQVGLRPIEAGGGAGDFRQESARFEDSVAHSHSIDEDPAPEREERHSHNIIDQCKLEPIDTPDGAGQDGSSRRPNVQTESLDALGRDSDRAHPAARVAAAVCIAAWYILWLAVGVYMVLTS